MLHRCVFLALLLTLLSVSSDSSSAGNCTGTRSKSGSRLSHGSKANFAGVGENGLCCMAEGIEEGGKAHGKGFEQGMNSLAGGMKCIAGSIAFSSVAIFIAFLK
jgi:hypothetical protein